MSFNEKVDQDNSDNCACTCNSYPPPVGFAANVVGYIPSYTDSDTVENNSPGYRQAIEDLLFTSGHIGSAESTGIIGNRPDPNKPKTHGCTVERLRNVDDSIKWTLKDGVLIFTGTGETIMPFKGGLGYNDIGIFSQNPYVKTVIIGPGITKMNLDFNNTLNITTVIQVDPNTIVGIPDFKKANTIIGLNYNKVISITKDEHLKGYTGNEAITEVKKILANTTLNDTAKAMIPAAYGGTGANPEAKSEPEPEPNTGYFNSKVDDWAKADVEALWDLGIARLAAYLDLTKPITRAQFADVAVEVYQTATGKTPDASKKHKFTDIPDNDTVIHKAYNLGIISGVSETKFDPDGTLTREQAATILARLANVCGKPLQSSSTNPFTDTISAWAKDGVLSCKASNIMNGVSANTFNAKATYSIQQALVTMLRLYNYVKQ